MSHRWTRVWVLPFLLVCPMLLSCASEEGDDPAPGGGGPVGGRPSNSGTLALTPDDEFILSLNASRGVCAISQVSDGLGNDFFAPIEEIAVGRDPCSVSIHPNGTRAYVSNAGDGDVSVIDLGPSGFGPFGKLLDVPVGSEPRGTALSPDGSRLYVANYGDGTISVVDTATNTLDTTIMLPAGSHPYGLAMTNNGRAEKLYATEFFAQPRPGVPDADKEGKNDSKEGLICTIDVSTGTLSGFIPLSPFDSGFDANRTLFCTTSMPTPAVNDTFCEGSTGANGGAAIDQRAYPNQLFSVILDPDSGRGYVPSIAASPEPPVKFNVNVHAFVSVIDPTTDTEIVAERTSINALIAGEPPPTPPFISGNLNRLDRAFIGDMIDCAIHQDLILFLSRSGSFVLCATRLPGGGFDLGNPVVRIPTGNIPTGVIINPAGTRAYVNSEVGGQVTVIDLTTMMGISTIDSVTPAADQLSKELLLGQLAFFTGFGLPADVTTTTAARDVDTHRHRNMASDSNWSSCASCHPGGLSDGVTWIFATGPRQTIALDGSFSPTDPDNDQRVFNWNAVRGSVTDFNNNARGVQGGFGFTNQAEATIDANQASSTVPDAGAAFNHGMDAGVSNALDLMTEWVKCGIRSLNRPSTVDAAAAGRGRDHFQKHCVRCHSGDKWTISQVLYNRPAFNMDPVSNSPQAPIDAHVENLAAAAAVITGFGRAGVASNVLRNVQDIGTSNPTGPIEIRGAGAMIAQASAGMAASFNIPSLLGVHATAPYGHDGSADTLEEVFMPRGAGGLGHDDFGLGAAQLADVIAFLRTIDEATPTFPPLDLEILQGPIVNPANGHIYYRLFPSSWATAEAEAVKLGGHLASIHSMPDNDFVRTTFADAPGSGTLWIGLNDVAVEGNFVWTDGSPLDFANWNMNEPNGGAGENVVQLFPVTGGWNDASTGNHFGVVEIVP